MSQELAGLIAGLKASADRLEQVFRAAMTDTGLPDEAVAVTSSTSSWRTATSATSARDGTIR